MYTLPHPKNWRMQNANFEIDIPYIDGYRGSRQFNSQHD